MTKENRTSMLKKIYGQNIGLVQNSKPIMIENPEFLKLTQNGNDSDALETESAPRVNGNSKLTPSFPKRGPTDKQLEMMTSDGRRRITPIFILPDAENTINTTAMNGNNCESFGKNQMLSSSSGAKSKIVIEKLDGIVEPNVSPGKKSGSPVSDNSQLSSSPAPKTNMIAIKHKPGPIDPTNPAINSSSTKVNGTASDSSDSQARAPPVNMIQVKKAPGKPPAEPPAKKTEESVSTSVLPVKKKINRIESSSSDSDSSDSDSSSSSSDDETTSQTSKSGADTDRAGQESSKTKAKPDKPAVKPPVILNNKRKMEDGGSAGPAKKPRGRPPGTVSGTSTPVKTVPAPATAAPATPASTPAGPAVTKATPGPSTVSVAASHSVPGLPPLSLNNNRANVNYSQHSQLPSVTTSLASHPLAQLSAASTGLNIKLDEKVEVATMSSNIEAKLSSSLYLGSGAEYRYWLGALVKNLSRAGQETRLRTIFDDLMGPSDGKETAAWKPTKLGIDKRQILKEILPHVAANIGLQRLYTEYMGQLKTSSDLFS